MVDLQEILDRKREELGINPDDVQPKHIMEPTSRLPEPEHIPGPVRETRLDAELNRRLVETFGGRTRYHACHLKNYQCDTDKQRDAVASVQCYADEIATRITTGSGIVFFGPPGTGKDHLMAFLIQTAVRDGKSVTWKNGMDLFGEVRDRMDIDRASERAFVDSLVYPDVLAISDPLPPRGELTEFQAAMLFRIIDGRYGRRKATWVTLNVESSDEARKRLGSQAVDRLTHDALVIPCNWPSYRKPRFNA